MQGEKIVPDRDGEDILDYELVKDHLYHKILTDKSSRGGSLVKICRRRGKTYSQKDAGKDL